MTIKFEKKISEYSQKKINNHKKEIKSLLMSMIGKKSTAGMKLEEGEKANLRKQLPGWEPPRQLPKFSKGGICSTKQMTNCFTQKRYYSTGNEIVFFHQKKGENLLN